MNYTDHEDAFEYTEKYLYAFICNDCVYKKGAIKSLLHLLKAWLPKYLNENNLDPYFSGNTGLEPEGEFSFSLCMHRKQKYIVFCHFTITPVSLYGVSVNLIHYFGNREIFNSNIKYMCVSPDKFTNVLDRLLKSDFSI